jgi:predicted DNA-binding antitoxin AbrB/MazE fold protein
VTHKLIAVYEDGVLKPISPLPLNNGDRVEVIVVTPAVECDDDYDILEALNANRLAEGARPLIPPKESR